MAIRPKTRKIVLIGSGNVATHLGKAISHSKGYAITQVYSKTRSHAKSLGLKLNLPWTNILQELNTGADLYIIAVKDDVISQVVHEIKTSINKDAWIVHTSGSASIHVFKSHFVYYGAFYPLQTFSIKKKSNTTAIPIFITASTKSRQKILTDLARSISNQVKLVNDEVRSIIHLSAVMVNNFPNYWYHMAATLLKTQKMEFNILLPLIEETTSKLKQLSPYKAQTGPARRKDRTVIEKHRKILKQFFPEWLESYNNMTALIQDSY